MTKMETNESVDIIYISFPYRQISNYHMILIFQIPTSTLCPHNPPAASYQSSTFSAPKLNLNKHNGSCSTIAIGDSQLTFLLSFFRSVLTAVETGMHAYCVAFWAAAQS